MKVLNKPYIKLSIVSLLAVMLMGCADFLEEVDQDKLIPETTDHYASLLLNEFSYQYPLFFDIDHMTDNISEIASSTSREANKSTYTWQREIELDENGKTIDNNTSWQEMYEDVAIANYIIGLIDEATGTSEEKDFVKGEAYFVRALSYFCLVNLYGEIYREGTASVKLGVPLRTDIGIERTYYRNTLEECYAQIEHDIEAAVKLIGESGITKTKYHPTVAACNLLMSRVNLYQQNWAAAIEYANLVTDEASLVALSSENPFVTTDNQEVLYSYYNIRFPWSIYNISPSGYYSLSGQNYKVSEELIALYDANDNRKEAFFDSSKLAEGTAYYTKKYSGYFSSLGRANLRVAEAYLNRAEAYAQSGQAAKAIEDIQTLHQYRYSDISGIVYPSAADDVLAYVLKERRKELCFEGHHRWFDLRRMENRPVIIHEYTLLNEDGSQLGKETYQLYADDPNYLLPIPMAERDNNPLIRNNERIEKMPETNINIVIQ